MERLSAWRSIALVYFNEGPRGLRRGAQTPSARPRPSCRTRRISARSICCCFYTSNGPNSRREPSSMRRPCKHLGEARKLVNKFPCMPEQAAAARPTRRRRTPDDRSICAGMTPPRRRRHRPLGQRSPMPTSARPWLLQWCRRLEIRRQPEPAPSAVFLEGPRAGTSFDFAQFGIKGIPVGAPCTDGAGSTGTATAPASR